MRDDVHSWFGLTYSNYLVLPRVLLQGMNLEWQHQFVALLEEMQESYSHVEQPKRYVVTARNDEGKFIRDPIPHYRRGHVEPRLPMEEGRDQPLEPEPPRPPTRVRPKREREEHRGSEVRRPKPTGVDGMGFSGYVSELFPEPQS